jgi:hypothetical protein
LTPEKERGRKHPADIRRSNAMESQGADRVEATIAGVPQETLAGANDQVMDGYRKRHRLLQYDGGSQTPEIEGDELDDSRLYLKERSYKERNREADVLRWNDITSR